MTSSLKTRVEAMLAKYPQTRESDQLLTLYIWAYYYPDKITKDSEGRKLVRLVDILELPREDNVKRIRAKFNEAGKYLPKQAVVIKRRKQADKWRTDLGYSVPQENKLL